MAHFKRGNLQLKTDQQIQLGDSQESLIKYDGSDLLLNPSSGAVELYHAEIKRFETTSDGALVTGNLYVSGNLTLDGTTGVLAQDVSYNKVEGATYSTAQEGLDQLQSAGVISGGVISEDSTSTISITAGTGLIRTSDSRTAPLVFIDWPGTSLYFPEDVTKNIVVKYNSGSPQVFGEDISNVNTSDMIVLGEIETVDGALFLSNIVQRAGDFKARLLERMYDTVPVMRVGGTGLILGESADGGQYVTMSEGNVWALLEYDAIDAIDTETGGEFAEYWSDGGSGWNVTQGNTQWPNLLYDDGSGNLALLNNNRYGNLWFYLIPSDNSLHMLYGTSNTNSLATAEAEAAPGDIPHILAEHSLLLGRIIFQQATVIAWEVQTAFDNTLSFAGTTVHGNLSGLANDDHTQYSLVTGTRDFTGTVGGIDPVSSTDFVTLGYMTRLGTDTQRMFWPVPGTDGTDNLEISVERLIDVKHVDFDIAHEKPAWQEGRVFWDTDNHTFGVYNDVAAVTLQVGQESHLRVRNESGALIPDGAPVYISGASQGLPTIELAKADDVSTLASVTIATHDIDNGTDGYTTVTGAVNDVDTSQFDPGDILYISDSTAGVITSERPKSPSIAHPIGVATSIGVEGRIVSDSHPSVDQMQTMMYTSTIAGVADTPFELTGTFSTVAAGIVGDEAADWAAENQHAWLFINSLTGSGVVTITGTSVNESSAVPVIGDTEVITVDASGTYYQTDKKWWEITNIDIPAGISAINYDYGLIGYPDMGNRNFRIIGYRIDAYAQGVSPDLTVHINKIQDDGNKKMSIIELENITVDDGEAADELIDNLRTGADDRSYNPTVAGIWPNNTILTLKQLDFSTYFTNSENDIMSKNAAEGFFIFYDWAAVDYVTMYLYYELIP